MYYEQSVRFKEEDYDDCRSMYLPRGSSTGVHRISKIRLALFAFSAFLEAENAESAENARVSQILP